jgi:hypothetical protein
VVVHSFDESGCVVRILKIYIFGPDLVDSTFREVARAAGSINRTVVTTTDHRRDRLVSSHLAAFVSSRGQEAFI